MTTLDKQTPVQSRHFAALLRLAATKNTRTGQQIWHALRRVECALQSAAEKACNEPTGEDFWPAACRKAEAGVMRALGRIPDGIHINGDPRGYALKLEGNAFIPDGLEKDWGGYGILAPEL